MILFNYNFLIFSKFQPAFEGKCNHEMIHKILTEHRAELQKHEQEALMALRTHIHKIGLDTENNMTVFIYLDIFKPIKITEGKGENELVINISNSGLIDYAWAKRTIGRKLLDFVTSVPTKIINGLVDTFKSLLGVGNRRLGGPCCNRAIKWTE